MGEFIACDECGQRSYSHILLPSGGELYLCGHHLADHEEALNLIGALIIDNRDTILQKPEPADVD